MLLRECHRTPLGFGGMERIHRARWAQTLEGLLDDELDADRVVRVLRHLEECPECLGELEELVRLQRALARLEPVS